MSTKEYMIQYRKEHPWQGHLYQARQRCINPKKDNYQYYGGKGIKNELTLEDIKYLWFRDKAYLMKEPSLDRKNSNKDYILDNCQFIEMKINIGKGRNKKILQYTKDGILIKEWYSISEASNKLNINHSHISECAIGKLKSCGGFIWKYKGDINNV